MRTLAAGLSMRTDLRMVAPSLVTETWPLRKARRMEGEYAKEKERERGRAGWREREEAAAAGGGAQLHALEDHWLLCGPCPPLCRGRWTFGHSRRSEGSAPLQAGLPAVLGCRGKSAGSARKGERRGLHPQQPASRDGRCDGTHPREVDCRILSMPLGPREDLTRSAMERAPTIEAMRACSPLAS